MSQQRPDGPEGPVPPDLAVEELEIEADGVSTSVIEQALKGEHKYATLGLVLGVLVILGGVVLIVLGFTGSVDITFESGASKGHLVTGSLGIVLAIVGLIIVRTTRLKVTIKGSARERGPTEKPER